MQINIDSEETPIARFYGKNYKRLLIQLRQFDGSVIQTLGFFQRWSWVRR